MKKASLPLELIVIAAIVLIVLIVVVAIFAGRTGLWNKQMDTCTSKGGSCAASSCTPPVTVEVPGASCPDKANKCCVAIT